ncbi:MAG: YvcK family protein, partial [Eggerthellaceae bacterium]|nr:YvcK family protein [Eggerthellaceae bacterium]
MPEAFGHDPSATAVFAALPEVSADEKASRLVRAVVIGGGTGAPISIRTLLSMNVSASAVVAMADDGGST